MGVVRHGVVAAVLAALLCAAGPAGALEFKVAVEGRELIMQLAGHLVTVPGPLWAAPGEQTDVEKSQIIFRQIDARAQSVQLVPLGETLVNWTRILGVLAVNRPNYLAAHHVASMVEPMVKSCAPDQTLISKVPATKAGEIDGLLLMCGRYRPTARGPRNCAGTILVAVVLQSSRGAMQAYQEWCTGTFDIADRTRWPIAATELSLRLGDLQNGTSFVPMSDQPAPNADTGAADPGAAQ